MIENSIQEICQYVELSYDKILNSLDQLLTPQQFPKLIINSPTLYSLPQERPLVINFANETVQEITPLIDQFKLLYEKKQEQLDLSQIKNSELQNTLQEFKDIKRNEQNNYDQLLQDTQNLLQQKELEIKQLHQTQSEIIKDQQQKIQELQKQKDYFLIENAKQKQEDIIQNEQLQQSILLNSFTFSQTYKNSSCQVSQNGKLFYNKGLFYSCLCDQAIPNQGIVKFGYLIHDIGTNQTMVGIGAREIISKFGYSNIQDSGKGAYLIMSSGYCFSHHQKEKYHNSIPFTFTNNDIIIIEVGIEQKYIKWIKKSTKQSFLLEIDPNYEYYPCINGPGKVEILNEINP
ncbi:unnamed protein product [Paramecium primaurelia]|uniref:Uncharacterized protein n=1 Tax=Paramecium primaurelia TaxID=5886 RepID=A0A8S1N7S5_PARPR|nr:unnamed protein product [Paramecium primaurelia]